MICKNNQTQPSRPARYLLVNRACRGEWDSVPYLVACMASRKIGFGFVSLAAMYSSGREPPANITPQSCLREFWQTLLRTPSGCNMNFCTPPADDIVCLQTRPCCESEVPSKHASIGNRITPLASSKELTTECRLVFSRIQSSRHSNNLI